MPTVLKNLIDPTAHRGQISTGSSKLSEVRTVTYDEKITSPFVAAQAAGFIIGTEHVDYPFYTIKSVNYESLAEDCWRFTIDYEVQQWDSIEIGSNKSSTRLIPFTWEDVRTIHKVNTVGEVMSPPIQERITWIGFNFVYFKNSPQTNIYTLGGAVNDAQIKIGGIICPAFCAQIGAPSFEPVTDDEGKVRWKHTLPIKLCFKKSENDGTTIIGFKREFLNNGFNLLVGGEPVPITRKNKRISTPVPINETGTEIATAGNEFYISHTPTNTADFSTLKIPQGAPRA